MRPPARFIRSVAVNPGECWLWRGPRHGQYGRFYRYNTKLLAHRYAYMLWCGDIPDGLDVAHKCDVPLCVNPAHLFLATHQENMADRDAKGRQARGVKVGTARLTPEAVSVIRAEPKRYGVIRQLAARYGVSTRSIHAVRSGEFWSHV